MVVFVTVSLIDFSARVVIFGLHKITDILQSAPSASLGCVAKTGDALVDILTNELRIV